MFRVTVKAVTQTALPCGRTGRFFKHCKNGFRVGLFASLNYVFVTLRTWTTVTGTEIQTA